MSARKPAAWNDGSFGKHRDRKVDWLGDLDSNQSYRSQSPGFYR